jgi:Transposase DDE domain
LYDTLVHVLSQPQTWLDRRHLKTLAWMMVGLVQSRLIGLTAWTPDVQSRAVYAQSSGRRVDRWRHNTRIEVHQLYGPLMQHALAEWGQHVLYLALDTSTLWDVYCRVRIAIISRGRAVPLVGQVLHHPSSRVAYAVYKDVLDKAATRLPLQCPVVFLADRGFADTQLMEQLRRLNWHWRIRIKRSCWIVRQGRRPCQVKRLTLAPGEARFVPHVYLTEPRYGPVQLALARRHDGKE